MSKNEKNNLQNINSSKKQCYINAFRDLRKELEVVRKEVFDKINTYLIDYYEKNRINHDVDFVFYEPASRIKSELSFEEKLVRKNYINLWKIETSPENKEDYKKTIIKNLDDIIGFRINCYFKKDEENIYKDIIDYFETNGITIKDYRTIDNKKCIKNGNIFEKIKKQANGEPIFKLVCILKNDDFLYEYPFELQIKCLIHNLWGEVDHEIAYKAKLYDYNFNKNSQIVKAIFENLKSSDAQLISLYKNTYDEMDMVNSLFFLYSHEDVRNNLNGKNPTFYYHKFFTLFNDDESKVTIKKFVGKKILNDTSFCKDKKKNNSSIRKKDLENTFLEIINTYNIIDCDRLREIKVISEILFDWESENNFYEYLLNQMYKRIEKKLILVDYCNEIDDDDDDDNTPFNGDSESNNEINDLSEILRNDLIDETKKSIFTIINTRKKLKENEKEILCRVFFTLIETI